MAAVKRIKSKEDAKDLVQDLFYSFWMRRDSFIMKTSLSSYLFTAIKYRVINYVESNIVKGNYLNSLDKASLDYDNSTTDGIMTEDLQQFLDAEINGLSPRVRIVFELSRKENLSIAEIAERLKISDQTVKNQIAKALKVLRVQLSDSSGAFLFVIYYTYWSLA